MAQQGAIIPQSASTSFPGCALSCTTLSQAQDVCMPPNQPAAGQLTYDQCFCASLPLAPFRTTTDGVCMTECTILADRQLLQAWYNNFCAQVSQGIDPTTQTATTTIPTVATSTLSVTTGTITATTTSTSAGNSAASSTNSNQSWIEGHWQWVMGIAIIAVGLGLLAWFGVWFKKRHRRKVEAKRAAASGFTSHDPEKRPVANDPKRTATPDLWGPHQMMQATQGYGYAPQEIPNASGNYRGAHTSKKVDPDAIEIQEPERDTLSRPSARRARPSELEINARMIGAADRRSKSRVKSRGDLDKDTEIESQERDQSRSKSKSRHADVNPETT